jgi:SAM-dependent methyltransferase
MTTEDKCVWSGTYKIPWDDPDLSRRMLREHLSQEHDLASRRSEWIDRQVAWIHTEMLDGNPSRILDLGCGPGLYSSRLALLGHHCRGIDFGPASIEYARRHDPDESRCEFFLGDIRQVGFGGPCDLAMILYGELNVFPPSDALGILRKAHAALPPGGRLIAEVQTAGCVERMGRSEPSEQECAAGLFSDRPHRCRTESRWLPEVKVAVQTFTITERASGEESVYRSTTQAWSDADLARLLAEAGFDGPSPCDGWPCDTEDLVLWIAGAE